MARRWASSLASVVAALGGKGTVARCPVHEDRSPSLSLGIGRGGVALVTCHAGCERRAVLDELERRGLVVRDGDDGAALPATGAAAEPAATVEPGPEVAEQRRKAAAIWAKARPIEADTVPGRYLRARGCRLPHPDGDLRWLPASPPRHPLATLVARVTAFDDADRGLTLHFTPVRPDGTRGDRHLMAGLPSKGVIRVDADDRVTGGLFVAEGIETALSLPPPAWATVSAGTLAGLPVLDGLEALTIAVDADDAGQRAAERCAATWHDAGREVRLFDLATIRAGSTNGL